ncbi:MAG TPA: AMP-binding protein [Chitinivibrionales bacterium]|nr:AMP-binding protein [Chitinivibrionales bacterium]
MVFRPELSWEFLSADEIEARSVRAMRNHVRHAKEVSPHYQNALFDVFPDDIKTRDDIRKLPFTEKSDVVEDTNMFLGVTPEQIVETVVTSGSTGKPLVFSMTANDVDRLAFNEALSFYGTGVTPKDRAQILVSLDRLFIAGMAYYRGLSLLGVNTARIGVLPFDMQKYYIDLLKPTVVVGVPSFLLRLAKELAKLSFDTKGSSIEKLVCIGEAIRGQDMELNTVGRALEELYDAKVYSTYASTELSCAFCECTTQYGGHAHPELVYTEIVDETGKEAADGQVGELVATPLGVEAMPLLRYKTGDITFKVPGKCACGRNSLRVGPILARKSQMIKIKGTTVYPLAITNVLDSLDGIEDYIIVLEDDESGSDRVTIHAATMPSNLDKIGCQLRAQARVQLPVLISNITTIQHFRGKSAKKVRVVDSRKKKAR